MFDKFVEIWTAFYNFMKKPFDMLFPTQPQKDYLKSLLTHKYWVFKAGMKIGVPLWMLIIHDWSKFLPDEFNAYADKFFNQDRQNWESAHAQELFGDPSNIPFGYYTVDRFNKAWLYHQHRNPHHWQHWYLNQDTDPSVVIPMPEVFAREMVADWAGAGRGYTGKWEVEKWYSENMTKIKLHRETRVLVESLIIQFRDMED
jgi:Family of unknown function (DUF5662)